MSVEIDSFESAVSRSSRMRVKPAPSLRLPVTAGNRALLRRLRAAELAAWEAGRPFNARAGSSASSDIFPPEF